MSAQRQTVREAWEEYRKVVMHPGAGPTQMQECRRAFYAGAHMLLCATMTGLSPGDDITQADEDYIGALHYELLMFAAQVKKGEA